MLQKCHSFLAGREVVRESKSTLGEKYIKQALEAFKTLDGVDPQLAGVAAWVALRLRWGARRAGREF